MVGNTYTRACTGFPVSRRRQSLVVSGPSTSNGRDGTSSPAAEQADLPRFLALKRLSMAAVTGFVAVNLFTGAPLFAVWVGSHVGGQALTMIQVFVVLLVLAVSGAALAVALTWLNNTYDELIGRAQIERRVPWLRSMRAEAEGHLSSRVGITALERIVMVSVFMAVIALVIWLIFFAGSPLPPQAPTTEPRNPGVLLYLPRLTVR
jgi:hypothetical protein